MLLQQYGRHLLLYSSQQSGKVVRLQQATLSVMVAAAGTWLQVERQQLITVLAAPGGVVSH
jgi:hypothetical protein